MDTRPIKVLHATYDLQSSDYLAHAIRIAAPNVRLEASPPNLQRAFDQPSLKGFDIVLLDDGVACTDCLRLIAHINHQGQAPAIVAILGNTGKDPLAEILMRCADDHVDRGPNFVNELANILQRVSVRYRMGTSHRASVPRLYDVSGITSAAPEPAKVAEKSMGLPAGPFEPEESELRSATRTQVHIPCTILLHGSVYPACIKDVSEEGLFLEISSPPPAAAEIVIHFKIYALKISQDAIVMHEGWYLNDDRNFYGCGVRFRNLTPKMRNLFKELATRNSTPALRKIMLTH